MVSRTTKTRMGTRGQPEESRAAILDAASREFAHEGLAGARTDAIAKAAHVNKALLYYYFKDKESLYSNVLDHIIGGLTSRIQEALSRDLSPKEKILAYVGAHFDYIVSNPRYPRIMQGEMIRAGRGNTRQLERIVKQYFGPTFRKLAEVIRAGQAEGEFRPVDPLHFIPSMMAMIVFYFSSAPVMRVVMKEDPLSPVRIAERRAAVMDFISAALFQPTSKSPQGERQ